MSLQQPNTSAARSRSLRVPAKAALTAPQSASATISSSQIPTSTSNVALFLTNLRLLDLDHEPDWPGITLATFSAKDAASGQKKRIQCVEWALYQLFSIWDYDETQNKLRPFFPPLDQVQSINLRAALLRALEQAKKNGVLGRDTVLRKTMLDECKGERLEEVLAVFSSAVLKKLVAERALNSGLEYRPTISENISLENRGYLGDRTELHALLLAHKVSLRSLLTKKNAARAKYRGFEELLSQQERDIAKRKEQAVAETDRNMAETSEKEKKQVQRIVKTNWTGNDQWIDTLLFSETPSSKGGLFGNSFDDIWAGVQEGRISDLEDQNTGLLEQLDNRVRLQKARLEKWDDFRKQMFGDMPPSPAEGPKEENKSKGAGLSFTAHQGLGFDQVEMKDQVPLGAPPPEYARILHNMKDELEAIGKPKIPDFSHLLGGSRRSSLMDTGSDFVNPQSTVDPISDISEWEDELEDKRRSVEQLAQLPVGRRYRLAPPRPNIETRGRIPKAPSSEASFDQEKKTYRSLSPELENPGPALPSKPLTSTQFLRRRQESAELDIPSISTSFVPSSRDVSPTELLHPMRKAEPMSLSPDSISPTQAMADEILASMSNTSPSPMKKHRHTLSLAERTRMSMTRTKSYEKEDDASQLSPIKIKYTQSNDDDDTTSQLQDKGEEYEDLVARTRRSMAGFEAARQKAQLERRRSERKSKVVQRKDSYFPKLEEETIGDTSIAEELMEGGQEVDYEAVFKSRPRVQTSPLPSPSKPWNGE